MTAIFHGELYATPGTFRLQVERLIVDADRVRLAGSAVESDSEPWEFDVQAMRLDDGSFDTGIAEVTFARTKRTSKARFHLTVEDDASAECSVEGTYELLGDQVYELSGELMRLVPPKR